MSEPKSNLLQMPKVDTLLNYELNDVELRGAEHLMRRAAYHLDKLYYLGDNIWATADDAGACQTLIAWANELSGVAKARAAQ